MAIDLDSLRDDQDAGRCNRCGGEYVFKYGEDSGFCAKHEPVDWQRHLEERAEARKRGGRRLVRAGRGARGG